MQESYPVIGKVPTHIMTWGKWIEESFAEDQKEVVICITGNPGLPGFYTRFLKTIHECLNKEVPVWVIGHAGHDEASESPYKKPVPPIEDNEELYNLHGQLQHKVSFIRKYVPSDVKIHLIGHSIGCYLALKLLKIPEISKRVQQCYFLFPTVERMAASPNGFNLTKIVQPILFIIQWLNRIIALLPTVIKVLIIYLYFLVARIPSYCIGSVLKLIYPPVLDKVWFMALDEMVTVFEVDLETIQQNKHRLKFYYGTTDGWVPVKYYHELKQKIPDLDAELCTRKIDHCFVLRFGEQMGFMVAEWIIKNREALSAST